MLVCDDNPAMRTLLGVVVGTAEGLLVVGEASDGDEVILEAGRLQPDVILLDLAMPNRSGLDALPDLRQVAPDAQIIVLSGFTTATVAAQVLALGAVAYLEKGVNPETIVSAVRNATDAARRLPSERGNDFPEQVDPPNDDEDLARRDRTLPVAEA